VASIGARTGTQIEWLTRPRWAAACLYALAIAMPKLGWLPPMPTVPLLLACALTGAANLVVPIAHRRLDTTKLTVGLLLFDATVLTAVLYTTGGASNPLSALYLLPIALAAVMLPARWAWVLAFLGVGAFRLLFYAPSMADHGTMHGGMHGMHDHAMHGMAHDHAAMMAASNEAFALHLEGMWIAFSLTAVAVAYFVTRVSGSLRDRDRQLAAVRARAERAERVAALASLAASTSHELGTPLGTIMLAATEMQRAIERGAGGDALRADATLVHDQARRCREILDAMLVEAGEVAGEAPVPVTLDRVVTQAIDALAAGEGSRVDARVDGSEHVRIPQRVVSQVLHNLLRNAFDASATDAQVSLRADATGPTLRFTVEDRGAGMTAEQIAHAAEPFVSGKPGRGKGLGLFLVQSVADRLGGRLAIESTPGLGTRVTFTIPRDVVGGAP
jgi:two-component system sensor histidine kinase RegB